MPLSDPQNWDEYWAEKNQVSSKTYDFIASAYRRLVIKPRLERYLFRCFADGSKLLHAGCGTGQVDKSLHGRMRISAVDISTLAVEGYRRNNPLADDVLNGDIFALPFPEQTFDGAYNLGVLEHFTEPEIQKILNELHRVLKPGANLVLFWPHARASSVAVLKAAHWVMSKIHDQTYRLHPAEVSLLRSRQWVTDLLERGGFALEEYSFGPQDLFVQAGIVARRNS